MSCIEHWKETPLSDSSGLKKHVETRTRLFASAEEEAIARQVSLSPNLVEECAVAVLILPITLRCMQVLTIAA